MGFAASWRQEGPAVTSPHPLASEVRQALRTKDTRLRLEMASGSPDSTPRVKILWVEWGQLCKLGEMNPELSKNKKSAQAMQKHAAPRTVSWDPGDPLGGFRIHTTRCAVDIWWLAR